MDHFAGLDVSVKDTSICIVDDTGRILREVKVASEPDALVAVLTNRSYHFKRIGLEARPMSQWLFSALAEADLPVICVETRHMQAVLKAQIGERYRAALSDENVQVQLVPTAGSVENLAMLRDPNSGVSVALIEAAFLARQIHQGSNHWGRSFMNRCGGSISARS